MNIEEAKEYFKTTKLLEIDPGKLIKASKVLRNNPEFLINYPDHLGMYYKDIDVSSWYKVLLFETINPKYIFNKLRLISYMVYSSENVDTHLLTIVDHSGPVLLVLTDEELNELNTLFELGSNKLYFGHWKEGKMNICYAVKK